jgi:serine/threonine protein kinase
VSPALPQGFQLGACRIEAEIGRGPRATVYRAFQPALDRDVAVKVLATGEDPDFADRFRETSRTLARLRHANIAQVYDFGEQDGLLYLIRELVDGESALRRLGTLTPQESLNIVSQVASGLDYAHARDVFHGELLPSNVLLDRDGRALIVDFGASAGGLPSRAADVEALIRLARQLLSGQLDPPADLNVPPEVGAVLSREDFPTATAFATQLRDAASLLGGETLATVAYDHPQQETATAAYRALPPPRNAPSDRRPLWQLALPVAALLAIVAAFAVLGPISALHPGPMAPGDGRGPAPDAANPSVSGIASVRPEPAGSSRSSPAASVGATLPTSPEPSASAFNPPASASAGPTPTPISNSTPPLFMAISRDGANFATAQALPLTGIFMAAFGLPGGGLRIYAVDGKTQQLHAHNTTDFQRWDDQPATTPEKLLFGDLVQLPGGGFRLYYVPLATFTQAGAGAPQKAIKSALSSDGLNFAGEPGFRFMDPGLQLGTVASNGPSWELIASVQIPGSLTTRALTSTDGLAFTPLSGGAVPEGSGAPKLSAFDGQLHLLFAAIAAITSWSSDDGRSWRLDPGVRIRMDPTKLALQPSVLKSEDGVYRLLYSLVNRTSPSLSPAPAAR